MCPRVAMSMLVFLFASGCAYRTQVVIPRCVEKIEFHGEHTRTGKTGFRINHFWDLPFTKTVFRVEGQNGRVQEHSHQNTRPELVRALLSIPVGVLSAAILVSGMADIAIYGASPFSLSTLATFVVGSAGQGIAVAMAMTGWHPATDVISVPSACEE